MSRERDDATWLKRGKQREAVAQTLRKPMTAKEICVASRAFAPRLQLRDVWHLLKQMRERGLATCYNPRLVTGRLFDLTDRGRAAVTVAFGAEIPAESHNVDWRKYSWVVRARVRRLTLLGLAELESKMHEGQTATAIRKHFRAEHSVGLNRVVRAVKDLLQLGLVKVKGLTRNRGCKLYRLTPAGMRIVEQLGR